MPKAASPAAPGGEACGTPELIVWTGDAQENPPNHRPRQRTYSATRRRALVLIDSGVLPHDGGRRIWWLQIVHPDGQSEIAGDAGSLRQTRRLAEPWRLQGYRVIERGAP